MRFLGLGLEDKVPDAKTVWLYREQLAQAGVIETLFEDFDGYLEQQGYLAKIIALDRRCLSQQRSTARIKEGETPEGWEIQPANVPRACLDQRIPTKAATDSDPKRPLWPGVEFGVVIVAVGCSLDVIFVRRGQRRWR